MDVGLYAIRKFYMGDSSGVGWGGGGDKSRIYGTPIASILCILVFRNWCHLLHTTTMAIK